MLSSGNVPDLFDSDELEGVLVEVKPEAQIEGIHVEDKNELYKYLISVSKSTLRYISETRVKLYDK